MSKKTFGLPHPPSQFRNISGHFFYLMSFARPNFHSTSDCCWKGNCEVCTGAQSANAACLDPLVGVRHHRNQKVDQHHRCHQHVEPEDKLKRSKITAGDQNREELRTWNKNWSCWGFLGVMFISLSLETRCPSVTPRKRGDKPAESKEGEKELDYHLNGHSPA